MQRLQGQATPQEQGKAPVFIPAALYHITITESGRLECTPRWLLSMQEVTQLLVLSRSALWELSKQGDFPAFHIGKRRFVRVESLLAWIRAKEHPEREQPPTRPASPKNKTSPKTATKNRRKA
jgi:predicted DNA-binding transcriptional regulator AlpA